jgi:hypothetical protein
MRPSIAPTRTSRLLVSCAMLACGHWTLFACAHGTTQAPAAHGSAQAAKPVIPPGCEALISGEYRHEDEPSYRYRAQDDGSLLTLHPYRLAEDGTPGETSPKAQDMVLELRRAPEGFVGVFRMTEMTGDADGGVRCQALFAAKVLACSPTKLTLQIEQEYAMDQACKRVDTGAPDLAENVLVKVLPTADGG